MKKLVSLILVLALTLSLATTAFAATVTTGDQDIDVKAKYVDKSTTPDVYSVDITWGAMEFTCSKNGQVKWNPENHTYVDNTTTSWTANGNTVTVTNHSNTKVTASFSFSALAAYNTVTGSFDIVSDTLDAGVKNAYDSADSVTATLTLGGTLDKAVTNFTKVGAITVKIA